MDWHGFQLDFQYMAEDDGINASWDTRLKEQGLYIESIDVKKTQAIIEQKIVCRIIERNNNDNAEFIAHKLMHMEGVQRVSL